MTDDKFSVTDCWVLFSIGFGNKAVTMKEIISTSDMLCHAIIRYDEFVDGTNHLLVNDYISFENGSFKTTKKANDFYKAHKHIAEGCIDEWIRFSKILANEPFKSSDTKLALITEEEFNKAIDQYLEGFGQSILNGIEEWISRKWTAWKK